MAAISKESRTTFLHFLIVCGFICDTTASVLRCDRQPPYLEDLKNQVRSFYAFTNQHPVTALSPQDPCSHLDGGFVLARPQRPVTTLDSRIPERSTCPWEEFQDINSDRYPCRIAMAKLTLGALQTANSSHPHRPHRCLSRQGSSGHRSENKLCKALLQSIPIVRRTGCYNGENVYAIDNITINVGYTCTFVH